MNSSLPSPSSSYSKETSPKPTTTRSGLTLVLPSLKNLKAAKVAKKNTPITPVASFLQSATYDLETQEKKGPRPLKLKPLKEVLTKLIHQIKKKDDYAFFLEPVNLSQVPGYSDIIKRPMDLGTMTHKVARGKYRSLEEFANDLKLVTTNAKTFNPPGSMYYSEAERLEAWGLDHIAKAATTVIQYETDWNIDIEKDEDAAVNIDDDDENPLTSIPTEEVVTNGRSPSVLSQVQQQPSGRRGPRGPYKKGAPTTTITESIDHEGRLPGSKDGLGAFPPCSDWAKTMVALKLKGKRYKTKKERLRIEKEGPPYLPEGSLDYTEMEDPFSVLSVLAPDLISRPHLTPVYPPLSVPSLLPQLQQTQNQSNSEDSTPQPEPVPLISHASSHASTSFPSAISIPLDYDPLSSLNLQLPTTTYPRRQHWHIIRNPIGRKIKESGDDNEPDEPTWHPAREPHPADFGSFALLAGALSEEMKRRGTHGGLKDGEEERLMLDTIRDSVDLEQAAEKLRSQEDVTTTDIPFCPGDRMTYFTVQRAAEAESYIQDVVYGGPDGLAYVRSLSEFVAPGSINHSSYPMYPPEELGLGMSLAQYAQNLVDELTEGQHSLLRETAEYLRLQSVNPGKQETECMVAAQISSSLYRAPEATAALQTLLQLKSQKIDMSLLLNKPEELFLSEEEWAGKGIREKLRSQKQEASKDILDDVMDVEEEADVDTSASGSSAGKDQSKSFEMEGPEELAEVLKYVAGVIMELDQRVKEGTVLTLPDSTKAACQSSTGMSDVVNGDNGAEKAGSSGKAVSGAATSTIPSEDPVLRNLRLNLLALAKRAPLDTIARLPLELVPEHIRHFIPTLESTTNTSSAPYATAPSGS